MMHPDAVFVLAGDGPLLGQVRMLALDQPWIRCVSNVPDVASLLRAATIFVLPSEHEAAPLALLEAMASALPCVCTNVGGMPAMLDDGSDNPCGILIEPRRPAALAHAITRLLSDAQLRVSLGTRAQTRATSFSFDQEWATYCALYSRRSIKPTGREVFLNP